MRPSIFRGWLAVTVPVTIAADAAASAASSIGAYRVASAARDRTSARPRRIATARIRETLPDSARTGETVRVAVRVMSSRPPVNDALDRARLVAGMHATPHDVLGAHPARMHGSEGIVVRAWHPDAVGVEVLWSDGSTTALTGEHGLYGAFVAGRTLPARYRLRFRFADGNTWERDDPYRFLPTLGDVDLHLMNEGTHRRLGERLGARPLEMDGTSGTAFAVWAPAARRVS